MRTYRCEDVTLSERGIDSKGWLCNPQEKGKKPAILVLGPKDASNNTVLLQYATRLANYGFVVLGMEETQDVKAALDYLSLKDEVDPNKMYAMGICNGTNEVLASTEAEKRLKAIALVAGCYKRKEASRVKVPTIVIHGGKNEKEYQSAQRVYDTICAEEKLAIWEGSVTHAQYFEDPLVLDKTVRNVFRWFKTH